MTEKPIRFFFEGDLFFKALEESISQATQTIDIELYYFSHDTIGARFADLLIKKTAEGVIIRLIYDAVGCRYTPKDFFQKMSAAGIHTKVYNPFFPSEVSFVKRDHRKTILIDGKIGYLGGYNLAVEYSQWCSGKTAWRDSGVSFTLPTLTHKLGLLFEDSWQGLSPRHVQKRNVRPDWAEAAHHLLANYGWSRKSPIRQEYLSALVHAQKSIYIMNAYFVPDRGIRRALRRAAQKGVEVRLIVAGRTDVFIVRWATHALYSSLLRAGIRIFEYQPSILHAKSAVIDAEWYTIGTSNLDSLSFFKNLEVNLIGKNKEEAQELSAQFAKDLSQSKEMILSRWRERAWWKKLRERLSFLLREWL